MPATPKFSDRLREIGCIEVVDQVNAQDFGRAHRHDRAAAEIAVELQRKQQRSDDVEPALVLAFRRVDCRHKQRGAIRHHDFKEVAPDQQQHTVAQVVKGGAFGCRKLRQQAFAPADGARDHLREKADKQRKIKQIVLGPFAAVGVHQVAHGLQGVERNAHRQQEIKRRRGDLHADMRQHRQHGFRQETQIFEPDQRGQCQHDARRQRALAGLAIQQAAAEVAHGGNKGQHRQMRRVPAKIEEIAGQQQPDPPGLLGHRKIPQRRQRQKQQKLRRIENHRYSSDDLYVFISSPCRA